MAGPREPVERREMAAVMSELLHMAAAMGRALLTMIVIAGLAIALFVHI